MSAMYTMCYTTATCNIYIFMALTTSRSAIKCEEYNGYITSRVPIGRGLVQPISAGLESENQFPRSYYYYYNYFQSDHLLVWSTFFSPSLRAYRCLLRYCTVAMNNIARVLVLVFEWLLANFPGA